MLSPFVPFSSQQLHEMLGYGGTIAPQPIVREAIGPDGHSRLVLTGDYKALLQWKPAPIPVGQAIAAPKMLFEKLDESGGVTIHFLEPLLSTHFRKYGHIWHEPQGHNAAGRNQIE